MGTMAEDVEVRENEREYVEIVDSVSASLKSIDKQYNRLLSLQVKFDENDDMEARRAEMDTMVTNAKTIMKAFIDDM